MAIAPSTIDPYIKSIVYFCIAESGLSVSPSYMRRSEVENQLMSMMRTWIDPYDEGVLDGREYLAVEMFDNLSAGGFVDAEGDDLSGTYYSIKSAGVRSFASAIISGDQIHARRQKIGERYLHDIFAAYLSNRDETTAQPVVIPASDRLVRLDDNQPQIDKIRETARGLSDAMHHANDVGDFEPDELKVAASEVSQLVTALDKDVIRQSYIAEIAPRILKWITDKAAGAAIGKAAWALLILLAGFFGLNI